MYTLYLFFVNSPLEEWVYLEQYLQKWLFLYFWLLQNINKCQI